MPHASHPTQTAEFQQRNEYTYNVRMKIFRFLLPVALPLILSACSSGNTESQKPSVTDAKTNDQKAKELSDVTAAVAKNFPGSAGHVVNVRSNTRDLDVTITDGVTDRESNIPLTNDTPVRIASVTKTFTAATVLRLYELGKVDLKQPISTYLSPELLDLLRNDKFNVDKITVRDLLAHTSGIEETLGEAFQAKVIGDPTHVWTRVEHITFVTENFDPLGEPGTTPHYSDVNYILLGDLIEQVTGKTYAAAMREILDFKALGLRHTYLEKVEQPPQGTPAPAHYYVGDIDAFKIDASYDLFGGGGLIASMGDLSTFYTALTQGKVFENPDTYTLMTTLTPGWNDGQGALGIDKILLANKKGDITCWGHDGFGGTAAIYCPEVDLAISVMFLQAEYPKEFNLFDYLTKIATIATA
jgi:D-alanyl-D-alanine carboxypeptidase